MSLDVEPRTGKPTPPRRSRARWIVVAAAVVVVAVAAISSLVLWVGEDDDHADAPPPVPTPTGTPTGTPTRTAGPSGGASTAPQTKVTRLTLGANPARCMVPSVARLRQAALAFQATVGKIGQKTVILNVTDWKHADGFGGTDTVRVALPGATTEAPVTFESGKSYLVAATGDAQVMVCGLSGEATPDLTKLYAAAF